MILCFLCTSILPWFTFLVHVLVYFKGHTECLIPKCFIDVYSLPSIQDLLLKKTNTQKLEQLTWLTEVRATNADFDHHSDTKLTTIDTILLPVWWLWDSDAGLLRTRAANLHYHSHKLERPDSTFPQDVILLYASFPLQPSPPGKNSCDLGKVKVTLSTTLSYFKHAVCWLQIKLSLFGWHIQGICNKFFDFYSFFLSFVISTHRKK